MPTIHHLYGIFSVFILDEAQLTRCVKRPRIFQNLTFFSFSPRSRASFFIEVDRAERPERAQSRDL